MAKTEEVLTEDDLESGGNPLEQLDRLFRLTSRRTWLVVAGLVILVGALVAWGVLAQRDVTVTAPGLLVPSGGFIEVARLESGVVGDVFVATGQDVSKGQELATYAGAGGMQTITAPVAGRVVEVSISPGSTLVPGLPAFTLIPASSETISVAFASPPVHAQIHTGQDVLLAASSAPSGQYGSIKGQITRIGEEPATSARLDRLTGGNESLASAFLSSGPVYEVDVKLDRNPSTFSGYQWTTTGGPDYKVPPGTLVSMSAVVARQSIASQLFK
jgi:multidrug efflux pump subunit AcrA (membrane-fusion protein)